MPQGALPLLALRSHHPPAAAVGAPDDPYEEQVELVVGGCKPGTPEQTACYNNWIFTMMLRMLEHPTANTLVFLSVGKGVLELRAMLTLLPLRADEDMTAIQTIILVDPYVPEEMAAEVQTEFNERLLGVKTFYYTGDRAYDTALTQLLHERKMVVGAVGALNFGYRMSPDRRDRNNINTMVAMLEVAKMRLDPAAELYVVQAFHNAEGEYVNRDEPAANFIRRLANVVDEMTRWHIAEFFGTRWPGY